MGNRNIQHIIHMIAVGDISYDRFQEVRALFSFSVNKSQFIFCCSLYPATSSTRHTTHPPRAAWPQATRLPAVRGRESIAARTATKDGDETQQLPKKQSKKEGQKINAVLCCSSIEQYRFTTYIIPGILFLSGDLWGRKSRNFLCSA